MTNVFNTINRAAGILVRSGAEIVEEMCPFYRGIDKIPNSEWGGKNDYKSGTTVYVSIPPQYVSTKTGFDLTSAKQDVVEERKACTADITLSIGVDVSSEDLATETSVARLAETIIAPAASQIAQDFENILLQRATQATFNSAGTAGSNAFTVDDVLTAKEIMGKSLAPVPQRTLLLDASASRKAVDSRKNLFTTSEKTAREGAIGEADSFMWKESQLLYRHTNGNDVTGVAVNDAATTTGATTLAVDGLTNTTGTVTAGSVFTIAGVFRVHPRTKVTLPELQQFVVTANATANGSGQATLSISPTIYGPTSGARQNVSALPADDAVITFVGAASTTYTQSLAYQKQAFRAATLPLYMPRNAEFAASYTTKQGITMALVRDYDVNTRKVITRLDLLGAFVAVRPEFACRLTS